MPRVSDEYRTARRSEIAEAAMRCLARSGVHETSMQDIAEEAGLSIGAIYSHFSGKAELSRYIASTKLGVHLDELEAAGRQGVVRTPREVLTRMLDATTRAGAPASVVLQFWAASMVDDEMRAELDITVERLRSSLSVAILPWAREHASTPDEALSLAGSRTDAVMTLARGYLANRALFGDREPSDYLDAAASVLV